MSAPALQLEPGTRIPDAIAWAAQAVRKSAGLGKSREQLTSLPLPGETLQSPVAESEKASGEARPGLQRQLLLCDRSPLAC